MTTCIICYKQKRDYKLLNGDLAFISVQAALHALQNQPKPVENPKPAKAKEDTEQVAKLKRRCSRYKQQLKEAQAAAQPAMLTKAQLMNMIQLCHPDKHQNSRLSTEVTQWLMMQRNRA